MHKCDMWYQSKSVFAVSECVQCAYIYDIMCICWSDCCMCPKSLYACVRYVLANWNFVQSENKDNIRSNINIMRHEMMKRYIMRTLGKHRDHSIFVFANKKTPDIPHKKGTINRRQLDTYINDICSEFRTLIGTAHTKVVFFFFIIFNPKHCFTLRQTTCCFAQGISIRTQQQQNRWFPQKFGTELDWLCKCGEISIAPFTRSIERNFHIHRAQFRCGTWTIITYDGTMISEFIREITRAILLTIDAVASVHCWPHTWMVDWLYGAPNAVDFRSIINQSFSIHIFFYHHQFLQ